jgi:hypothetical protein
LLVLALLLLVPLSACEPNSGFEVPGGSDAGVGPGPGPGPAPLDGGPVSQGCTSDADCAAPLFCDQATKKCSLKGQCGAMSVQATTTPPNLLIVLDRSCSMKAKAGWGGPRKWDTAVAAIDKLLAAQKGKMQFGITFFPDRSGSSCTQESFPVPTAPQNEAKIQGLLKSALTVGDTHYPNGPCITNIDTAMLQAAKDPALADPARRSFVLLLTDGKQFGCVSGGGDTGTTKTIQDLKKKNVSTFVVGFGSGIDSYALNVFAKAGGKPSAGTATQYYKAEDQTTLDKALSTIAKSALGCQYTLKDVPATMKQLLVFLDSQPVQQDKTHKDGWDYDPTTRQVTLYGKACQDLQQGTAQRIDILLGCQAPPPPTPDAGPACKPGVTPCTQKSDCPDKHACMAGCCAKIVD